MPASSTVEKIAFALEVPLQGLHPEPVAVGDGCLGPLSAEGPKTGLYFLPVPFSNNATDMLQPCQTWMHGHQARGGLLKARR